jgi:cbb3-type cytochrome oxidase cytochrome c subunit
MPIPTDTYWNVKRLNWVFAISAFLLFAVTGWSIMQDWNRDWKNEQRSTRTWEAALTRERLDAQLTDEQKKQQLKELDTKIRAADQALAPRKAFIDKLDAAIRDDESQKLTKEFTLNNNKASLGVQEIALENATTANDQELVKRLTREIRAPRADVAARIEELAEINARIEKNKAEKRQAQAEYDALVGQRTKMLADQEALSKRLNALAPKNIFAKTSEFIRNAPLLNFVNPSEKPLQIVLPDVQTDVAFMKITTIDRCTSCHVNIGKKEFAVEKIVGYLEEEAAKARGYQLPDAPSAKAAGAAANKTRPGAVAMPDFWQAWAMQAAPDVVKKNAGRINTIAGTVGKTMEVTLDGQPLASFKFNPALVGQTAPAAPSTQPTTAPAIDGPAQNQILLTIINALYRIDPTTSADGRVKAAPKSADAKALENVRDVSMRYIEELRKGIEAGVPAQQLRLINDRYRYALADVVNPARKRNGYGELDPSPVLLAHPQLDMYVDADSKHPMESGEGKIGIGCTSCHDGSGQETDFVLAAHVPRDIMVDARSGVSVPAALLPPVESKEEEERKQLANMLAVVAPEDAVAPKLVSSLYIDNKSNGEAEHSASKDSPTAPRNHGESRPVPYTDPHTGKQSRAVTQMAYWKGKYEPIAPRDFALVYHEWDWPMRPPQYLQANCARCHTQILDIKDYAPTLYEGRRLFAEYGCVNCHTMDSIPAEDVPKDVLAQGTDTRLATANGRVKVGPSLTHVTSKLSPAFINTWIWAPKAFRPSTRMPHFFMLENNSSDEEIRRTRQEARAITEYLVRTATPLPPQFKIPAGLQGKLEGGKAVFNAIGCQACHANLNDPQPEKRNNKNITLGEKWIVTDLVKARAMKKDEAEKLYDSMTYNERQTYAKEHFEQEPGQTKDDFEKNWKYADGTPKPIFVHVGPELSGVGTKLTSGRSSEEARQWLYDWVKDPRHYSNYTIMPRLRLTDQQAIDLVEYLMAQKRTNDSPKDDWQAGLAPIDNEKQIELTALFLRSKYSAVTALKKADDDSELTDLAIDALRRTTKTPEEKKLATDEAAEQVKKISKEEKRTIWLGKKLIAHYGCMGCHAINGTEDITSPCADLSDWGQKGVDKLDYGYVDPHKVEFLPDARPVMMVNGLCAEASRLAWSDLKGDAPIAKPVEASWPDLQHLRTSWITQKLKNTRIFDRGRELLEPDTSKSLKDDPLLRSGKPYDKLKMPTFYLNDEQVHQIVTFVVSNRFLPPPGSQVRDRLVSDKVLIKANTERARTIARGRELTNKFNCVSCHWIENNVPQVQQYYKPDELLTKAPPPIRGEGNKVQFDWLFNFFRNVENLRPLLYQHDGIRMPSFPATDDEFGAIIAYFSIVSNKEAADLKKDLDPVIKYVDAERAKQKTLPPGDQNWPGDDWITRPEYELAKTRLTKWSLETRNMSPIELDPSKNSPAELGRKYRQALYKAQFTIDLYAAPFPFVEDGMPHELSEERFKLGQEFMNQMQCLSCHYLGDPNAPGAVKDPKAPNLSLMQVRLQRRWARHWVQEPPVIQPGTSMPAFFSSLSGPMSFNPHGQTWSETAGRPKEEIEYFNSRYGKTADEQAALVLDFLFAAGARNMTAVQAPQDQLPKPPAATTKPSSATTATATKGNPAAGSPATTNPAAHAQPKPVTAPSNPPAAPRRQPDSPLNSPMTQPSGNPSTQPVGFLTSPTSPCIADNFLEHGPPRLAAAACVLTSPAAACLIL